MAKAPHPADDFEAKVIAEADHWTAFQYRGARDRQKATTATREEARAEGIRMVREHPSKPAMIYAVSAAGRQAHAETIQPEKERPMTDAKTYSAKSTAVRAARKALGADARIDHDFIMAEKDGLWTWEKKADHTDPGAPPKEKAPQSPLNAASAPAEALSAPEGPVSRKASAKAAETAPPRDFPRATAKTRAAQEAAGRGELPSPPDFSADTHKRFRPKLDELVALVEARDVEGLKAFPINPISTSPKALDRYRNLAVTALEAKGGEPEL